MLFLHLLLVGKLRSLNDLGFVLVLDVLKGVLQGWGLLHNLVDLPVLLQLVEEPNLRFHVWGRLIKVILLERVLRNDGSNFGSRLGWLLSGLSLDQEGWTLSFGNYI